MTLQEKILYCRKKQGLSQEALAEKIGVSRQAISKWETGEATPEVGKLALLAKTFDVTVDWLLSEEEPEKTSTNDTANNNCRNEYNYSDDGNYGLLDNRRGIFKNICRLIVKYSWIAGVYIALSGLLVTGVGFGARVMFNTVLGTAANEMNDMENKMNDMMGSGTENKDLENDEYNKKALEEIKDEVGEGFPEMVDNLEKQLNVDDSQELETVMEVKGKTNGVISAARSITNGFTLAIIIVGMVMIIAGIVLAGYLKIKENQKKELL